MSTAEKGAADDTEQAQYLKLSPEQRLGGESIQSVTTCKNEESLEPEHPTPQTSNLPTTAATEDTVSNIPHERQVIAVSASKNPAAFFNLARRFLVSDEYCDLSALEGAIVSAVDAAHLLERSKLAKIVRIQTSYVAVEPRKKNAPIANPPMTSSSQALPVEISSHGTSSQSNIPTTRPGIDEKHHTAESPRNSPPLEQIPIMKPNYGKRGSPLRRSRIIITVKRTEEYKLWLEENEADTASETTGGT